MTLSNEGGPLTRATPRVRVLVDLATAALPLLATAAATSRLLGLPTSHVAISGAGYVVLALALLRLAPRALPAPGIGWANRITLFRAVLSIPVVALLFHPGSVPEHGAWWVIGVAGIALALDGVDGAVARRTGTETGFGARFDMEVDALLILALSVLAWTSTPLGFWVVGIGAIRYLFLAAAYPWPFLDAPLPPSFRRKAICVVQSVALLVCLAPPVPDLVRLGTAAFALALLVYSFAVDVRWLVLNARESVKPAI
ncbi:MAG: CDP-alcohol phosphatidyltransferase family protein [Gemmatimonadota bacterium]